MHTSFYIHIGVNKTGSKSIQHTLFKNREKLLPHGINYSSIEPNLGPALFSLFSTAPDKDVRNIRRRMDTPEKAAIYNEAIRRKLVEEFAKNTSPKMVISAEGLSTLPKGPEHLKALLDPYASKYRIIVYVRDYYDYTNSAVLQRLKDGEILGDPNAKLKIPRYKHWLWRYIRAFGRENVDIRLFDPKRFVGGDLIPDFLTAIGEPHQLAEELEIERANQSLSHEAAMILSAANQAIPTHVDGRANPARFLRLDKYLAKVVGEKFSIDPANYREHEASIFDDLKWLHKMLGEPVFEQSKPRPASVPRWSAATVDSIKEVVGEMAERIRNIRARSIRRRKPAGDGMNASSEVQADIAIPPGLEWLREAVHPQTPLQANSEAQPAVAQFDQASIRSLACFIHELACTIRGLTRKRVPEELPWIYRRYQINGESE
jgi:hypothetical protein